MKIAIITEAGENIGFGHLMRCLSVACRLKSLKIDVEFILNEGFRAEGLLAGFAYKTYSVGGIRGAQIQKLIENTNAVLIDSYQLTLKDYELIAGKAGYLICMDDFLRLKYPPGMVINAALDAQKLPYSKSKKNVYVLGVKYAPLRPEFEAASKKLIRKEIQDVLVTLGGDDCRNLTPHARDLVLKAYPKALVNVVIGGAFKNIDQFKADLNPRVKYYFGVTTGKIIELMGSADVAVSAGGQTLYELARIGTPTLAIGVAQNQHNNLKAWEKHRFIKFCGWHDEMKLWDKMSAMLKVAENQALRRRMSRAGQGLVDGRGALRIATKILQGINNAGKK
jgi:UDP-2,4-diacetamido-2,4,6-trideoxy-beta-L-altropyranose hydrolase